MKRTRLDPAARRAQLIELGVEMLATRTLDELSVETASVCDGIAPLVWTTLLGLGQYSDQIAPYTGVRHSLIEMMVLMMKARRTEAAHGTQPDSKLDAIKRFIRNHLADPELSVEAVAQANYLSVRSVHKLFAETGETPAAWIRAQRLHEAKRAAAAVGRGARSAFAGIRSGFSQVVGLVRGRPYRRGRAPAR